MEKSFSFVDINGSKIEPGSILRFHRISPKTHRANNCVLYNEDYFYLAVWSELYSRICPMSLYSGTMIVDMFSMQPEDYAEVVTSTAIDEHYLNLLFRSNYNRMKVKKFKE